MQKPLFPALFLLAVLLTFGCSKSSSPDVQADLWVVSYFKDLADKDEDTAKLAGYTFEFNDNNEWLIHTPAGSTLTAKWAMDATNSKVSFVIENPTAPLISLLGDWDVTQQTDTALKLKGQVSTSPTVDGATLEFQKQ